jgi:hypothetical protein
MLAGSALHIAGYALPSESFMIPDMGGVGLLRRGWEAQYDRIGFAASWGLRYL